MTPHTLDTTARDDDLDARTRRIRAKILDGIEETLAEMARPRALRTAIEHHAEHVVQAHLAPLSCRQTLCRRAGRCRRQPCKVPAVGGPAMD